VRQTIILANVEIACGAGRSQNPAGPQKHSYFPLDYPEYVHYLFSHDESEGEQTGEILEIPQVHTGKGAHLRVARADFASRLS
jgi:hypothetical protein